jgi:20S proteasome alpha/beta subunit
LTLVLTLRGRDGIVLAADSRGTFGDPREVTAQNDTQRKAFVLSRYAAAVTSGAGELGTLLMKDAIDEIENAKVDGATAVMQKVRQLFTNRYADYFPGFLIQPVQGASAPIRPDLSVLIAGFDLTRNKRPSEMKLYSLQSFANFAPFLHDYGFALNGVPQYALYLLNRLYDAQASIRDLSALAVYTITETASQDGKVGGPVQLIIITEANGCQVVDEKTVINIIEQNEIRSQSLKDSFFGRTEHYKEEQDA